MIPKVIHYCWFGRNPLPQQVKDYIATWREHCPNYEIKEWNEDNFDIHINRYVYEAYMAKKFAFVSDYARLYALYTEGGIYLDTDVEVRKSFDEYLSHKSFLGWEADYIGTGMMAAAKGQEWVKRIMGTYEIQDFIKWTGKLNNEPNPYRVCRILRDYGLKMDRKPTVLKDDIAIYSIEYFCAHCRDHTKYCIDERTVCVHHYAGTWSDKNKSLAKKLRRCLHFFFLKIRIRANY